MTGITAVFLHCIIVTNLPNPTTNQKHKMKNTSDQIETGAIVQFIYGAGYGESFGILVEIKETEWGTQYKIINDEGNEEFTSEIRNMGETTVNGSSIGCYLVK
jgi:hypothetical protein